MQSPSLKSWGVATSSGNHFDVLDGLRGIAILMVVVFHTFYTNPAHGGFSEVIGNLIRSGWMGVPIFFVLSGFLISYPFFKGRRSDPWHWKSNGYAVRRFGKIIPPFYLSLVIFSFIYWVRFHDVNYLHAAGRWAIGLESYTLPIAAFNLSYWSLMVEAHFYALLPLLFFITRGLSFRITTLIIVGLMLVIPLSLRQWGWPDGIDPLPQTRTGTEIRFFIERFPFCLLDYFAFGVAFSSLYAALKSRVVNHRKLASIGLIGVFLLGFTLSYWAYACQKFDVMNFCQRWSVETFKYLAGLSGCLLLFLVFDPKCLVSRVLSWSWLRFIGIVSYEWFLFHGPIVSWFRDALPQTHGNIWLYFVKTVVPLAMTFAFAVIVYRYFSLPILNRIRTHRV